RHLGRGHHGGAYAEGIHRLVVAAVHAPRDGRLRVVGVLLDDAVDLLTVHGDDHRIHRGGGFLYGAVGMAGHVDHGIDIVVAQRSGLFGGGQLRCQRKVADGPAQRVHHHIHGVPLTGAGVADIEAFALEVLDVFDVGIGARHDRQRLAVQREHGAHVGEGARIGKVLHAFVGLVLDIRLHYAHVHLTAADGIHVGD